jgi:hypothetical protein
MGSQEWLWKRANPRGIKKIVRRIFNYFPSCIEREMNGSEARRVRRRGVPKAQPGHGPRKAHGDTV